MKNYVRIVVYPVLFLLCGLLHVVMYGVPLTDCIMQILYGSLVLLWAQMIRKRIVDIRVRRMILVIAGLIMMYILLQAVRYKLCGNIPIALRYSWYAYYIPMIVIPLALFYLSLFINLQENEVPDRHWRLLYIPCCLLIAGFLTNDLHGLAFHFEKGYAYWNDGDTKGILYIVFLLWTCALCLSALVIMLRKCRLSKVKYQTWIPLVPYLFGAVWMGLNLLEAVPEINGIALWQIGEMFGFMNICFVEGCILIGIIPANSGYQHLFRLMPLPVVIFDSAGNAVNVTAGAQKSFEENADTRIYSGDIDGGSVSWAVDISAVEKINQQILDVTEQIKSRNEYLCTENRTKEAHAELAARNRLYDRISTIVRPQLQLIQVLLESDENEFIQRLSRINVLNVYVKRRGNMELIFSENEHMPVKELTSAVQESAEHLKFCGVDTMVICPCTGQVLSEWIIMAYEFFESVIEACMESLAGLVVRIDRTDETFTVRLMLNAAEFAFDAFPNSAMMERYHGRIGMTREEDDMVLSLELTAPEVAS